MNVNIHNMNNINEFNLSLLGFLNSEPMHGYELHKKVMDLSGFGIVWNLKIGKLYSILKKLESENLVQSVLARDGNRPFRHEFSITEKGENLFGTWLCDPVLRGRDFRIIFLLKLYFSLNFGREKARQLIDAQLEICKKWQIDRLNFNEDEIFLENKDMENFPIIVNRYRQIQINGYLEWLNWCKNLIN